ncbi:hypothetical protein FUAX_26110 [Fulvitalea axinellae]|uniref:Actin-fragmin kinase catalytic domain-containing protein n=1 Tax=Fulvitalea axinellae TaxID=1182444 RepID=A0AAU9CUM9_9BACT|nr:hypothetical protein FUAX_26110 [Fulvitalea axinellae]
MFTFRNSVPNHGQASSAEGVAKMPPVQRILNPTWGRDTGAKRTTFGNSGCTFFVVDDKGTHFVVKLSDNQQGLEKEAFSSSFLRNLDSESVRAPETVLLAKGSAEVTSLYNALGYDNSDGSKQLRSMIKKMPKGHYLLLMERLPGDVLVHVDGWREGAKDTLASDEFMTKMGELCAYDLIMGNNDRMLQLLNWGNMLYDPASGTIGAIDQEMSVVSQKGNLNNMAAKDVTAAVSKWRDMTRTLTMRSTERSRGTRRTRQTNRTRRTSRRSRDTNLGRSGDWNDDGFRDDWDDGDLGYGARSDLLDDDFGGSRKYVSETEERERLAEIMAMKKGPARRRAYNAYLRELQEDFMLPVFEELLILSSEDKTGSHPLTQFVIRKITDFTGIRGLSARAFEKGMLKGYLHLSERVQSPMFLDAVLGSVTAGIEEEGEGFANNLLHYTQHLWKTADRTALRRRL